MEIHVVSPGENVDQIAARYNMPVETLLRNNQIVYPYRLAVGQALLVGEESKGSLPAESSGYAYPFISPWVLGETLPFLTKIFVFSYGFTEDGDLIEPWKDDTWLIDEAARRGVEPILTLTPMGEEGTFNNFLASRIFRNLDAQQKLIWQLGEVMRSKGYKGVDLDFEYILAEDRQLYVDFAARLAAVMHAFGYTVSAAVPAKTSADQKGLLYEGIDFKGLGEVLDEIFIMAYEWGYTYGPPMAIAPLYIVRQVVEYALTEVPREKLVLGIPNYGYDWPLPFVQGTTKARTTGNVEAVQRAIDFGAEIFYDERAASPYFNYWQDGVWHQVWFEDVRSYRAKFDLIREFGLKGGGFWSVMQLFRAGLLLMDGTFDIRHGQNNQTMI
ncbi:MAG TPA: LysM peptidoglycan-binding domain-containing protein [Candidatus Ventrisoma faecale]|nr:LysM peptidoglycan-binding domain-containing protein [Candidatus Ventrisoma faecale]